MKFSHRYKNSYLTEENTFMKNNMGRFGVPVISQMKNYLFPSEYFYDSDYHMNEYGAEMRTEQLLKDLAAVLPVPEP